MHKIEKNLTYLPKVSTEFLWVAVLFSASLFALSLIPLIPNDFWWHLKVGEIIYETKTIPKTNLFAWTLSSDYPYFYGAWLGELLFYIIFRIGQVPLIIFTRNLLGGLMLVFISFISHRRSKSWRLTALVLSLFFLMFWYNSSVRTQMWAWIPFIIFFYIVDAYSQNTLNHYWLFLIPIIMVLWVNLHGSFILGLVIIGIYLLGEIILKLISSKEAHPWSHIYWLGLILIITTFTVFLNPRGLGIINYLHHMLTDQPTQSLILEWQPPSPATPGSFTFYLSILILIITLAYSKYHPRLPELLLIAALLWLAWNGGRYIIWYAIIVTPALGALISELQIPFPRIESQKNIINGFLILMLTIPVLFVQPWFVEKLPLPSRYTQMILPPNEIGPLLSKDTPIYASNYLKNHTGGKLFNDAVFASYLIWANPEQSVFIDLRAEMFPYQQWADYLSISQGINFDEILSNYGANRILLNRNLQAGLEASLVNSEQWRLEYSDDISQIWIKDQENNN